MRTGYKTKPYEKSMEVFQNFSGGLNTVSPPDGMLDSELSAAENEDISERGSLKRRHGMRKVTVLPQGKKQGYFRYYKLDGTFDRIYAIEGKLYKNENWATPLYSSFQTDRHVEAVQFNGVLYVATGTKLLQYDGTTCKIVDPYLPTTMEMTYIGSNILSGNPEGHLKHSIGLVPSIDYVLPTHTYSGSRIMLLAKVFTTKINGETYEFIGQARGIANRGNAWSNPEASRTWSQPDGNGYTWLEFLSSPGEYEVRVLMRKVGTTLVLSEWIGSYIVPEAGKEPTKATATVHKCNRVLLHWGRLMLYGDPDKPATLYMSHLNTPNYVPALLNLEFDNPRREELTAIVHYRNSLVAFTKTSAQALYGTGPDDYRRVMLHTDIGCISPFGAAVMKNHIGFVSLQGVYALKTIGLTDDKATVEKLDTKISNIVPSDTNAIAVFSDDQLQITFPNQNLRLRLYHELAAWTRDFSEKLAYTQQYVIDGDIYCLGDSLYVFDKSVYTDDGEVYTNSFETKSFNFGQPYHSKKLKELQVLTNPNNQRMESTVVVYADESKITGVENSFASVDVNGNVVWNVSFEPNFVTEAGTTLGVWKLGQSPFGEHNYALKKLKLTGKCKRTKLQFFNEQPNENHFIGFAYIFKTKKP